MEHTGPPASALPLQPTPLGRRLTPDAAPRGVWVVGGLGEGGQLGVDEVTGLD